MQGHPVQPAQGKIAKPVHGKPDELVQGHIVQPAQSEPVHGKPVQQVQGKPT